MPNRAETTREGELAQVVRGIWAALRERSERDETGVTGKARQDEPVDGFADCSGEELDEAAGIASVGAFECAEVAVPLLGPDDHRRVIGLNELPVGQQPSDASVAVGEGMDALEPGSLWRLLTRLRGTGTHTANRDPKPVEPARFTTCVDCYRRINDALGECPFCGAALEALTGPR